MNTPENDPLRALLGQWKIARPLPPRFKEQVWRRIEQREPSGKAGALEFLLGWLESIFARRAVAVAYVTVLLAAGLMAGYVSGQAHEQRGNAQLAARYVQSIDPYYQNHD
ncbi:MAG: hypothetical protein ABSG78_06940 [Verrucomicrobiota bacterium]|jgi:hypothetical protein